MANPQQVVSPAASSGMTLGSAGSTTTSSTANSNKQTTELAGDASVDLGAREARIGPGDVLGVRIFGVPEMSQDLRVSNAGIIVLPMIGPIHAQGLTTAELEEKIAAALRNGGFMNEAQVNVSERAALSRSFGDR